MPLFGQKEFQISWKFKAESWKKNLCCPDIRWLQISVVAVSGERSAVSRQPSAVSGQPSAVTRQRW